MSQIKDDLICEIIRISQTNLLGKKQSEGNGEQSILEWIKNNAESYRNCFSSKLDSYSATELGNILNKLTQSGKDLNQVLEDNSWTPNDNKSPG